MPAALLTMAVMISGPTKSTLSVLQTPMMTGATRMTAVALGSRAQTGATSATMSSSSRLPLPPVARRKASPSHSKIPVLAIIRATTMPPKSRASGPPAVCTIGIRSPPSRIPNAIRRLTPSRAATAMSIRSKAIKRITAAKMPMVRVV